MTLSEIAALHESGHVICYRHFDDKVKLVELLHAGEGHTRGLRRVSTNTPFRDAMRCLTGPASEAFYCGDFVRDNSHTDLWQAAQYLRGSRWRTDDIWPAAMAVVKDHHQQIEGIAQALLRRRHLTGTDIERLLGCGWISSRWA
jgi:hypothetical protein